MNWENTLLCLKKKSYLIKYTVNPYLIIISTKDPLTSHSFFIILFVLLDCIVKLIWLQPLWKNGDGLDKLLHTTKNTRGGKRKLIQFFFFF